MWGLSIGHWVIVVGVLTLLFGSKLIVPTMKDIGKTIKEIRHLPDALDE